MHSSNRSPKGYQELGFAKIDTDRERRRGCGEVIYGAGKTTAQLCDLFKAFRAQGQPVLATRCTQDQADALRTAQIDDIAHDPVARTISWHPKTAEQKNCGLVAICTGGTADIPVAEEAARTAEFFGARVERFYDVGVAGIHRLLANLDAIRQANAIVAVAGMEGALASVVGGLVDSPVIAVPTSVGYGASFQGIAPLLTMLNSCAEGVAVVNIDNGFGAGYMAAQINRKIARDIKT